MQTLAIVGASLAGIRPHAPHGPKVSPDASSSSVKNRTGLMAGRPCPRTFWRGSSPCKTWGWRVPTMLKAPIRSVRIAGAGFIGAEVASTAQALGAEVTVVCSDTVPLSRPFGREMAADISALHEINGVQLICDAAIESYYGGEGVVSGLRLADGRHLPADVVLVAVGAIPNTEWLASSGVELRDGVLCDPMGRTNAPGAVAVGDCAAWLDEESGKHWRLEHWAGAVERPAAHSFLAVYYRGAEPVAVLGANQPRLFTKWRRQLNAARAGAPRAATPQVSAVQPVLAASASSA
jgi:NADPH-dependent 2,4-dienoyl-CoA reductase/sulfur reductase-like enzyme